MLMAVWKIWSAPVAREKRCNTSYIVSFIFSKAYCRDMRSGTSRWRALKKCSTSGDPSCASTMCPWKRRSPTLSSSFPRVWVLKSTNREDTSWLKHSCRGFGEKWTAETLFSDCGLKSFGLCGTEWRIHHPGRGSVFLRYVVFKLVTRWKFYKQNFFFRIWSIFSLVWRLIPSVLSTGMFALQKYIVIKKFNMIFSEIKIFY